MRICAWARGELVDYAAGRLEPQASRSVGDHLRGCADCWEQYERIRAGVNLLRHLPVRTPPVELVRATQRRVAQAGEAMILPRAMWSPLRRAVAVASLACIAVVGFASYFYVAYSTEDAALSTMQRLARDVETQELLPWLDQVQPKASEEPLFAALRLVLQETVNFAQQPGFETQRLAFLRERIQRAQMVVQLRSLAENAKGERQRKLQASSRICEELSRPGL